MHNTQPQSIITVPHRFIGSLLGLAIGDAVGTTLEFSRPGSFKPVTDMTGGGPFHLQPGQWTDDTSMALCLTESLIERQGFDPEDQMRRYVSWYTRGTMSCTGGCFDIGYTTRTALHAFQQTGNPFSGKTDPHSAGNGSIMRLAPVPLAFHPVPGQAVFLSGESSRTTHGTPECVDACRYLGALIVGALLGNSKENLLKECFEPEAGIWKKHPLVPAIHAVAQGSFRHKQPPQIQGTGYVVQSLEAALWAFYHSQNFEEGLLKAVNLGDDADTTGAVYGQIAGAFYGIDGIPQRWRTKVAWNTQITQMANKLYELSGNYSF
ncbi:MAG: ADP-ribosylglycohydrolase family protein [SAR324 cluster bacterium]|nr:ADP-ribosylglycohydrolase family protein [SAR324 cluster bacterium]